MVDVLKIDVLELVHLGRTETGIGRKPFFQNSSVVLLKFVSKEKNRSFEYRHVLYVLLNSVLSKIFQFSKEWYSNKKMLI